MFAIMFFKLETLDNATYNCPWVNTSSFKCIPTKLSVCPCDLLMVIAKHGFNGNCKRLNEIAKPFSEGIIGILDIYTLLPFFSPTAISASITRERNRLTVSLVPLQSPSEGQIFLNNMTGIFSFRTNLCGGNPEISILWPVRIAIVALFNGILQK